MMKKIMMLSALSMLNLASHAQFVDAYANADLHLVGLVGQVHKCIEGSDNEKTTYIFDYSGRLQSSRSSWGRQVYENPKRDEHGRIIRFGSDEPNDIDGEPMYTYVGWNKSAPSYPDWFNFSGPECDIRTKYLHTEPNKAYLVSAEISTTQWPCPSGRTDYTYLKFDQRGNWIQRLAVVKSNADGKTYTQRNMEFRTITYWDEEKLELARLYLRGGNGVARDYTKAFELFKELAERFEDPDAMWELGRMYQLGLGTKKDTDKAAWCFGHSCDKNNPYGMFWYAYSLEKGFSANGVDEEKAKELYSNAATLLNKMREEGKDDHYTWEYLGRYFYDGIGVERDYEVASKWFERSAEAGNPYAQYLLGTIYDPQGSPHYNFGESCPISSNKALAEQMYEKAKAQGLAEAQLALGNLQFSMGRYDDAVNNYRELDYQGNAEGSYALAICYEQGKGVLANQKNAMILYKRAAERGNEKAKEKITNQ